MLNRQTGIYGGGFLRVYKSKEELKAEINKTFEKYISEFDSIPEALKDKRVDEVDRTPAENLAYQVGWTTLVLKWEEDERKGLQVKTPSDEFKWNQLGELYQWFTDTYAHLSLQELKAELNENVKSICAMIDSLSADELFKPHMRKWAACYSGFSREAAIFVILIQATIKEYTYSFAFMFQNGKLRLYSLGVHPNFFRKASLKWLMLLYPTNPAMSFT